MSSAAAAGGGWLAAKKRGRDDPQIERDRRDALDKRRQQRGLMKSTVQQQKQQQTGRNTKQKKAPKPRAKQRRRNSDADSSDDASATNSMDDFVVHDSEDEEDDAVDSSDDDDGILSVKKPKSAAAAGQRRGGARTTKSSTRDPSDDDDESSSDEITEVCEVVVVHGASLPDSNRRLPPPGQATEKSFKAAAATTTFTVLSSDDESDSFFNQYPKRTSKPPPLLPHQMTVQQQKASTNGKRLVHTTVASTKSNRATAATSATKKSESNRNDGSTSNRTTVETKTAARHKPSDADSLASASDLFDDTSQPIGTRSGEGTSLLDLEDTPVVPAAIRKKPSRKNKRTINDDDFCSDIDEAVAIACAISESVVEGTAVCTTAAAAVKVSAASSPGGSASGDVVDLLDDDENNDEDQSNDEYVGEDDEDAKAASSILATANELSARVLNTLAGWSQTATDGMIVDGALALSTMGAAAAVADDSSPSDHTWISKETMKDILPSVELSEYQLIGVNWLALLHGMKCEVEGGSSTKRQNTNVNGILADEMGLGKTCQTIAFLSWLKHVNEGSGSRTSSSSGGSNDIAIELDDSDIDSVEGKPIAEKCHPHLVIAPASVVSNWVIEFQKFAPQLNVVKYHGNQTERQKIQSELRKFLPGGGTPNGMSLDIILAPVTYFSQEKSDDRAFLRKFKYDYLVVDEAHLLKNARGMRYRSLDRFSTMHRLLLTGTPVQNSPKELMSLLCFLMPLFSRKNADSFDGTQGHDGGESMLQYFVSMQAGAESNDDVAYRKLKQLFSPFVLRRRKQDVLSQILPPKEQRVEFVVLDPTSRDRYNAIIADHVRAKRTGATSVHEHLFTQLRKAAHHPLMLRSRYTNTTEREHLTNWFYQYGAFRGEGCTKAKVAEELEKYTDFDIHLTAIELIEENKMRSEQLSRYVLDEQDLFCSAKFVRLQKLLPELIANGHRILIFSVWTTCLDLLSCLLEQMGLDSLRMDGQTAVSERQSLIDKFNRDTSIPIFLLSTKACGLGLNLTSADTCIQHDLDFNPAVDAQAEDRCHRIGQTKKVTIIKLVSKDTVDEDIYSMQQRKAKMNAAIMGSDAEWNKQTKSDKKQMLETAVNRFLQSPDKSGTSHRSRDGVVLKENAKNSSDVPTDDSEYL